jgi:hypothetical protein
MAMHASIGRLLSLRHELEDCVGSACLSVYIEPCRGVTWGPGAAAGPSTACQWYLCEQLEVLLPVMCLCFKFCARGSVITMGLDVEIACGSECLRERKDTSLCVLLYED